MIDLYHKYNRDIFVAAFITFCADVKLNQKGLISSSLFFWSYFEKVAHKLVVWEYVALCVWLFVTGAN